MVKNLPTVERSTKIRFGKHVPDSDVQAENTIVFNASNTVLNTPNSGSIYMSPVRFRSDFQDSNVVLMMYNRGTGELSESGESANSLLGGQTLAVTVDRGNVTSNTVQFINPETSVVTAGKMGVSNLLPGHTLSIGSNVYVDDTGSNVLVVSGGVLLDGNLTVNGGVTSITTENLKVKDAIIELGQNNTSGDTTLDLGLIMTRPQSNVTVGFLESSKEIVMSFTESSADSNVITPLVSEDINVHVYGRLYTEANVGVLNTNPMHTLDVGSNLYVDEFGSNILVVNGNTYLSDIVSVGDKLGVKTTDPDAELHVVGNAYVSSNLTVDTDTLHVDSTTNSVGIETKNPQANLHVVGNTYISSDLTVDTDTFHVDTTNDHVGINTKVPDAELHVVGNTYISDDLTIATDTLHVEASTQRVGIKTKTPDAELHVVGNAYVSSNLTVDTNTLHVDALGNKVGIKTKNPDAELHVVGNTYVSSNLTVDEDTFHVDSTTNSVGIETKNPQANLHVVGNVYVSSDLTVDTDTLHVDATGNKVGIKTKNPDAELHVVGNAYVSSDLTVDTDTFHVDVGDKSIGLGTVNPDANLHVVGNAYVSSDLTVDTDTFHVDVGDKSIGLGTVNPDANLHVVGNVYVSSNLTVGEDTLHVDVGDKSIGLGTVNPDANLHVVGNVYISSNVTTDGTLNLKHPTTALITDLTANVEVKLNQLANVTIDTTTLANEDMLVYDGSNWTNQLQNHTFLYARADETIAKGDAVYATGTIGNNMFSIAKARSNSSATMPVLGVAYQAFTLNQEGLIVTFGRADGVDTDNFQTGETVYVSNVTAGALSNVKPYGPNDLIQNVGLVVKGNSNGIVNVTGVGRSNDIPNAPIVADEGDINYVYVNDANNDLKKILPTNLLTQLQTLQQVTDTANTTSNTIQFTNATTGLVTTSNLQVGSNISVAGLIDAVNKHVPMVGTDGFLEKSPIYFTPGGTYVVSAAEAEFLGNLTLSGNTTILNSESVTISDRIFGVAANNSVSGLDSGFMIEHQEGDPLEYANVALIYHADEHRFSIGYTQNTFTDDHILHYEDETHQMLIDLRGNVQIQNNVTIGETLDVTGTVTFADDLTVGAVSNLFVDVSTSRVGINEASPTVSLDVNGDARVQDTTDAASVTTGALVVSGGLGVASNIHSTNVYAASHVGVGTDAATAPLHLLVSGTGETTNGIYVKNATGSGLNDSIVNLEVAASGGDPFITWNQASGSAFAMGLDSSENLLSIANSKSDLTTNQLLHITTAGVTTIENTTNSTSKTTGALIVGGGLGVSQDIHGKNVFIEDVVSNSVAVLDTTNATSKTTGAIRISGGLGVGEDIHGKNVFIEDVVSNSVAVLDTTNATSKTTGAVRISGGLGVSEDIHGKNVFIEDVVSNSVAVLDTTNATSKTTGAVTISGGLGVSEDIHGKNVFIEDVVSNSVAVLDTTNATSKTTGAVTISGGLGVSEDIHGKNVFIEDVVSNSVVVLDTTVSDAKNTGALIVSGGVGVTGALYGSTADLDGVVTLTDATEATSSTTGALKAAGGVGIAKDVYVGERAYVTGGLVTNTGGVTKKTYSFSGDLTNAQTIANSTIKITFSAHVFYAKIVAHLVESDDEVSTLSMECGGGHWTGGTPLAIAKGPVSIFGSASTNPWSSTITTTTTEVSFKPTTNMAANGHYNVFIEYISQSSSGEVTKITEGSTDVITFGY
jgi:hypothetical protein